MNLIEAAQMALDCMEAAIKAGDWKVDGACDPDFVFVALRAALATEQEPQQREWQGLTDEEIDEAHETTMSFYGFARAIEAKLKEKNA